jgi:tyrosyl-tRNA synthetase
VPENVEEVRIPLSQVYVKEVEAVGDAVASYFPLFDVTKVAPGTLMPLLKLDKIISGAGLSASNSEAIRKLRERAVRINGDVVVVSYLAGLVPVKFNLKVGRNLRRIHIVK